MIDQYQENEMKHCNQISEIILENARALEEIKEKCGEQLLEMEKYEEDMEGSINKMTLELLELKQTLIQKEDEVIELKTTNANLTEELCQSALRLEREGEIEA